MRRYHACWAASLVTLVGAVFVPDAHAVLISRWEAENDATDSMGPNDGTWQGDELYGAGAVGSSAFDFGGDDDYVAIDGKADNATQGTLAAWVYPNTAASGNYVVFSYGGGNIAGSRAGLMTFRLEGDGSNLRVKILQRDDNEFSPPNMVQTDHVIEPNDWTHLAVVSDGSAWSVFLNGESEPLTVAGQTNTGNWFGDTTVAETDLTTIGGQKFDGGFFNFFNGRIDDVRLYDHALPEAEIKALAARIIPEPWTATIWLGLGLVGLGLGRRRSSGNTTLRQDG